MEKNPGAVVRGPAALPRAPRRGILSHSCRYACGLNLIRCEGPIDDPVEHLLSCFEPMNSMEIDVLDPELGRPLARGTGTVRAHVSPTGLELVERGRWRDADTQRISFRNRLLILRSGETGIALAHRRHGPDPVRLVNLRYDGSEWHSLRPHACGRDHYRARVVPVHEGGPLLEWRVDGPSKRQRIVIRYAAALISRGRAASSSR